MPRISAEARDSEEWTVYWEIRRILERHGLRWTPALIDDLEKFVLEQEAEAASDANREACYHYGEHG
jgi:hypothetical protein